MRALDAARVEVEPGDILCLYTGFADMLLEMGVNPIPICSNEAARCSTAAMPGCSNGSSTSASLRCARTTTRWRAFPPRRHPCPARLPLHELCLFRYGIPLGELWYLAELGAALKAEGAHASC
jgi:hypothetical protein